MSSKATTYIRDKHEADILDGAKNLSTFVKEHDVPHCRGKLCPARLKPTYSLFLNNERISLMERILYEADSGTLPISRHAYDQFHVGMSRHASCGVLPHQREARRLKIVTLSMIFEIRISKNFASSEKNTQ